LLFGADEFIAPPEMNSDGGGNSKDGQERPHKTSGLDHGLTQINTDKFGIPNPFESVSIRGFYSTNR
jgi:hypothetical protein